MLLTGWKHPGGSHFGQAVIWTDRPRTRGPLRVAWIAHHVRGAIAITKAQRLMVCLQIDASRFFERDLEGRSAFQPRGYRQAFAAQKIRVEEPRLIACAVIGQDRHDGVPRPKVARKPDRARHVDT